MTLDWSLFFSVVAAVASVWGLTIMQGQLRVARNAAGGRAMNVTTVDGKVTLDADGLEVSRVRKLVVSVSGPGIRHGVVAQLRVKGRRVTKTHTLPMMDCNSRPLILEYNVRAESLDDSLWVINWLDPYGNAVRSGSIRMKVGVRSIEEWRWHRAANQRRYLQRRIGYTRRLGKWRAIEDDTLKPGQDGHRNPHPLDPESIRAAIWRKIEPGPWKNWRQRRARKKSDIALQLLAKSCGQAEHKDKEREVADLFDVEDVSDNDAAQPQSRSPRDRPDSVSAES